MSDRLFNMGVAALRAAGAAVEVALHEHDLHNLAQELPRGRDREAFYLLARTFNRAAPGDVAELVRRLGGDRATSSLLAGRLRQPELVSYLLEHTRAGEAES